VKRALALLGLLTTATSPPVLEPDGYGPVRVGMTVQQASKALGVRLKIYTDDDLNADTCTYADRTDGHDGHVSYMVQRHKITRIDVVGVGVKTKFGIGVGSTNVAVKAAYKHMTVKPNIYSDEPQFEWKTTSEKYGLIFETEKGRVVRMRGGKYPSVTYVEGCL
jgi:hypothetical protein